MKILQEGNPNWRNDPKIFTCEHCNCTFEADKTEYRAASFLEQKDDIQAVCECPYCGNEAYFYW